MDENQHTNTSLKARIQAVKRDCLITELFVSLGIRRSSVKLFHCPMVQNHAHKDQFASMFVNPLQGTFTCYVCSKDALSGAPGQWTGDIISMVMLTKKMDLYHALDFLEDFIVKHTKKNIDRGMDFPVQEKALQLDLMRDVKMYSTLYEKLWKIGVPASTVPEIVNGLAVLGINKRTLDELDIRYLNDIEETVRIMDKSKDKKGKYEVHDLVNSGIYHSENDIVFREARIVVPFKLGDKKVYLQGWDLSRIQFVNPKHDASALFNAQKLLTAKPGMTVVFCDDLLELMSYMELVGDPNELPVYYTGSNFNPEWVEYLFKKKIKIIPRVKTSSIDRALKLEKNLKSSGFDDVEIVWLEKQAANSINQMLRIRRGKGIS